MPKWFNPEIGDGGAEFKHRLLIEKHVVALLAGECAERRYLRQPVLTGMESDYKKATDFALTLFGSSRTTSAFLQFALCQAEDFIKFNWWAVSNVAAELLKKRTMSYGEFVEAISKGPKPRRHRTTALRQ